MAASADLDEAAEVIDHVGHDVLGLTAQDHGWLGLWGQMLGYLLFHLVHHLHHLHAEGTAETAAVEELHRPLFLASMDVPWLEPVSFDEIHTPSHWRCSDGICPSFGRPSSEPLPLGISSRLYTVRHGSANEED